MHVVIINEKEYTGFKENKKWYIGFERRIGKEEIMILHNNFFAFSSIATCTL